MRALLTQAWAELTGLRAASTPRTRAELWRLFEWFYSEDDSRLFAFVSVCHWLGIRPGGIRSRLPGRIENPRPRLCHVRVVTRPRQATRPKRGKEGGEEQQPRVGAVKT